MSPQAQVEAQVDVFDTSSLDSAVCDEIIGKDAFMEKSLQSSAVSEDLPPYVPKLPLRIRDLSDPENEHCVSANTREPFEVDNETCHARALLKVRTQPLDPFYAPYFEGKKRMFEIMVEGKLRTVKPTDRVYIGIEGDSKLEISGFWGNAAATIVMTLIECTVPHAHVTMGDNSGMVWQLVFPLDTTVDRLCITPPEETPPPLGVHMFADKYGKGPRRQKVTEYRTDSTYSFSLHSMYVDLVSWRLCNLPGIGYVSLDTFLRGQSLRFVGYAIDENHVGPHRPENKHYIFNFEIDNVNRQR